MKKLALIVFAVFLFVGNVSVFAGGKSESSGKPLPESFDWKYYSGTTITFMTLEHPITDGIRELLPKFEAATGIKVVVNAMAEDLYFDRMNVALRTKGNTDVYMVPMDGDSYVQQSTGLSQSISPFLDNKALTASDYNFQDFPSSIMELVKYSDGYYAIPASLETYILMYNKDIVDKYLGGKVPETMDELIAAANEINNKAKGEVSGAVVRGIRSDTLKDTITGLVFNAVGDKGYRNATELYLADPKDFGSARFDDPDIIKGVTRYAQLMKAGPANIQSMDWPEAGRAFELGKAGFFVDANLFAPGFESGSMKGKVGYSMLPLDNDENKSYSGFWGWGYGIAKNAKNPEAAWMFIQWISNPENDIEIAKFHGSPARNATWENSAFTQTMPKEYIEASKAQMATSRSSVIRDNKEKAFYLIIVDAIQDIYSGKDPKVALAEAKAKAEKL